MSGCTHRGKKYIHISTKKKSIFTTEQSHWEAPTAAYEGTTRYM